jgi:hypothetical protein
MSHYLEGKLQLKCSIDLLRRALINIMPEWEKHIHIDLDGKIPIFGYGGVEVKDKTFHLMVPGPRNPNYQAAPENTYGDLGMRKDADGSWSVMGDRSGMRQIKNLEEQLKGELLRMKAKAWANLRGAQILRNVDNDEESYIDIAIDAEDAKQFLI